VKRPRLMAEKGYRGIRKLGFGYWGSRELGNIPNIPVS